MVGDLDRATSRELDYPRDQLEVLLLLEEVDERDDRRPRCAPACPTASASSSSRTASRRPSRRPATSALALRARRVPRDLRRRGPARAGPAPQGRRHVPRGRRRTLACVQAPAELLQRARERAHAHVHARVLALVRPDARRASTGLRLPIPLGGTSNHFRADALRELGGWDPYNVTEDADLGLRAAAKGYRVGVIDSTTYEEACSAPGTWMRQRTRWIKGYMQTALVHMRHPLRFVREAGPQATATLVPARRGHAARVPRRAAPLALPGLVARDRQPAGHGDLRQPARARRGDQPDRRQRPMIACSALAAIRRRHYGLALVRPAPPASTGCCTRSRPGARSSSS